MAPSLCVDTDALINLLALGTLDPALRIIGVERRDCFRLRPAKHQIEKASWIINNWPLFDREKALAIVGDLKLLPQSPSLDLLQALNIDGIDQGEAYFLATLAENPEYLLLSGDRRMIEALHCSSKPGAVQVREAVRGRVIAFTQLIGGLVLRLSLNEMETRMRSNLCRHKGLRILFGTRRPTDQQHFWEAYDSEMRGLSALCGEDWLFPLSGTSTRR